MRESNEIRILVVEDTKEKLDGIISAMKQPDLFEGDVRLEITTADSFSSAQSKLAVEYFDVLVLDLKIPIMPKGEPKLEYSRLLFEFVQTSAQSKPFYVLGLTSAPQ
jgi:CheY-like chemotaxis protein